MPPLSDPALIQGSFKLTNVVSVGRCDRSSFELQGKLLWSVSSAQVRKSPCRVFPVLDRNIDPFPQI
jgi:hypothetical protein